ncbi:hypothetical protein NX059_006891 [Plenodomus lindquistii]|nr:hypothetical protein NX059_006891 [Plenodomus lindquistii]
MAQSIFPTHQYPSTHFVESSGAILFQLPHLHHTTETKVCLINLLSENEYLLPKGRRNINESRKECALREVYEETGYRCKLLPVRMATRACKVDDLPDREDCVRVMEGVVEPFMCTIRELGGDKGVKVIWWFVGGLEGEGEDEERGLGEEGFEVGWFTVEEAVGKLRFETDREVLRRAVGVVEDTSGSDGTAT